MLMLTPPGLLLYSQRLPPEARDREAYCHDCLSYARHVEAMIQRNPGVRGNRQFFRYALDVSCRGALLTSHRCPNYRRIFLKESDRFMDEIAHPFEACAAIRAC